MALINALGIIGVVMINTAYLLLFIRKVEAENPWYGFVNFCGGCLIIISLWIEWNLSAFLMELSWVSISLYGMISSLRERYNKERN